MRNAIKLSMLILLIFFIGCSPVPDTPVSQEGVMGPDTESSVEVSETPTSFPDVPESQEIDMEPDKVSPVEVSEILASFIKCAQRAEMASDDPENLCHGITNSYNCSKAIENGFLKIGLHGVNRNKNELIIQIDNAKPVTFQNKRPDDIYDISDAFYSYRQYYPKVHYHLIEGNYYEGNNYFLIDGRSGTKTDMHAVPVLSPDAMRFVAASIDPIGYIPTGVQIWRRAKQGLKLEYDSLKRLGMKFPIWGLDNPRWLNPSSIQFDRVEISENYERRVSKGAVLATLGFNGWDFMNHDWEE
ncbi:MAG: hypothetical protein JXB42_13650 [Deltaproteobacteria bacterium]|nr:hypothetical protein [Deltaproteobacteria bacterium]